MRLQVRSLALLSGVRIRVAVSCGVGHRLDSDLVCCGCGIGCRRGSDPALLWLWLRPAAATAPIRPLAWEPPYAMGAAQEIAKKEKKKKERKRKNKKLFK